MFCPQCGHQQLSNEMRFCSRCGLSLGLATDLLPTSGNQLQREKRELMGVGLMMATVLMLVNFFLVFGLVTLPHLSNRGFSVVVVDFFGYCFERRWSRAGESDSWRFLQKAKGTRRASTPDGYRTGAPFSN